MVTANGSFETSLGFPSQTVPYGRTRRHLTENEIELMTDTGIGWKNKTHVGPNHWDAVVGENVIGSHQNDSTDLNSFEVVSEDKDMLESLNWHLRAQRLTLPFSLSKIYILLTLLTIVSLRKIYTDPLCVKMKKGLVMDDPKQTVMDTSFGFPVKTSYI
ncbi:uncharacterized protein F5147DRAFT_764666 [Suillus discolor]|uniref:Uncharacterized protein n=1 Tax=Suillus discolor TaxID=1912936 RepID=A0A9P7ET61_9AGAM|nr:uncharacterized protein F5147DRAFT_764666 [Suillus discolor]KAG2088752.1 hypothetical protein F5147DRAFT_764666 [Suillus discolor]